MKEEPVRLSKIMALRGICSRREADVYIESGNVLVDGSVQSVLGVKVSPQAKIELLSDALSKQRSKVTILLHKPLGFVSTQPEKGYLPAIDLIDPSNQFRGKNDPLFHPSHLRKLSVAGRLDIESKGLLVLTQDGTLAKHLIGPESRVEKEYLVRLNEEVSDRALQFLRSELSLDGKSLKKVRVELLYPTLLRMVLIEGKKRQIRRICEQAGLQVINLKRVRIGRVLLGDLPEGKWRYLQDNERF